MKKIVTVMLAFSGFICSANAQKIGKMKHHQHHYENGMMMKNLNLSESQKEQLKANHESYQKELIALNKNEAITVKEARDKKELLRKEQKEKMMNLLTADQKTKVVQLKKERELKHEAMSAKRLDRIKSRLNLSNDQVAKIKAITQTEHAQFKAIKENDQLSRTEKKEQLMALKEQNKNNFKTILTPEQISKMEEMKKNKLDKFRTK